MQRRFFLNTSCCIAMVVLVMSLLGCIAVAAQPRFTVPADQLQQAVAKRFPIRYPVAGLLDLTLQAPELKPSPEKNKLNALMLVEASGQALHRKQAGTLEVEFALRYEVSDRTLRATALRFKRLIFPGLRPEASEMLNLYGQNLSEKALMEVVLHTLKPQDLVMVDALGIQPGTINVTEHGLVVDFVAKVP